MKPFNINIPAEEYEAIKIVIASTSDKASVKELSRCLDMNVNHLRFALDQLVAKGEINKICIDDRPHHKRYKYEVIDK